MVRRKNGLTGSLIATFQMASQEWRIVPRVITLASSLCWIYWQFRHPYSHTLDALVLLAWLCTQLARRRSLQFYEKGLRVPKNAGDVFLTNDQIVGMKLDGNRFCVTGVDADWRGPYSGGEFAIREDDLSKLREVLARFGQPAAPLLAVRKTF